MILIVIWSRCLFQVWRSWYKVLADLFLFYFSELFWNDKGMNRTLRISLVSSCDVMQVWCDRNKIDNVFLVREINFLQKIFLWATGVLHWSCIPRPTCDHDQPIPTSHDMVHVVTKQVGVGWLSEGWGSFWTQQNIVLLPDHVMWSHRGSHNVDVK